MASQKKYRKAELNTPDGGVSDTMQTSGKVDRIDSSFERSVNVECFEGEDRKVTAISAVTGFDQFYANNYRQLTKALGLALGEWQVGVEATDEAMTRAYQRWNKIGDYDSPAGWVYRVGLNWGRSNLRRSMRSLNPLYRPATVTEPEVVDVDLQRALATLRTDHRVVIVARYLFDWSIAQTAEHLKTREGTVKSRLHRALKELEQTLNAPAPTGEDS